MKISKISLHNNPILGSITFDFNEDDRVVNNIIFAGENGTGKSTVLDIIYSFSMINYLNRKSEEKWMFEIYLSEKEVDLVKTDENTKNFFHNGIKNNLLIVTYDFSFENWDQIKVKFHNNNNHIVEIPGVHFHKITEIFRTIFSDVEINYKPNPISSITSKILDDRNKTSIKSSNNLATEIAQLLVDIQSLDAADLLSWVKLHENEAPPSEVIDIRMKRFTNAFNSIFESKRFKRIDTSNGSKKVIFEEYGKEIQLDDFSSGEKQIIFRGSFLLKDQVENKGIVVLIDEPEISLHPTWQLKILDFYKKLFTNEVGIQESQIIFVTHSPFIIQNDNRTNDKVIILKRRQNGEIFVPTSGKFYNWTQEEIIKEAFNLDAIISRIESNINNLIVVDFSLCPRTAH